MYVDAFIIAVPEENKADYIKIAGLFGDVMKDFGVLEICENWESDVPDGEVTDFRKAVNAKPGEKIVVSWMIWPNKEASTKANEGMFSDPRMEAMGEMPFDGKRMVLGGFEPILQYKKP